MKLVDQLLAPGIGRLEPVVGRRAATYSGKSALYFLAAVAFSLIFVTSLVIGHVTDNVGAQFAAGVAIVLVIVFMALGAAFILKSGRAASDYLAPTLGFRPRWPLGGYWDPNRWTQAIERQKRWHQKGKWPIIPM
jgi:hypothetical protein